MSSELVEQALTFLRGSKTSEAMTPALRAALYSPVYFPDNTRLDEEIFSALLTGRDVVITGTAGGGKTMLVDQIVEMFRAGSHPHAVLDDDEELKRDVAAFVVRDLTAIGPERFIDAYEFSSRPPMLLAANEGALMDNRLEGRLSHIIDDLHRLQLGLDLNLEQGPMIVDMAAIDPVGQALESLLGSDLLHKAVIAYHSGQGSVSESPRLMALQQLADTERVKQVARLARLALGPGEVTFRELWNFIADMFLGGSDQSMPPTSVWFWRLFYGDSTIANELRNVLRPENLALPQVSLRLYRGDLAGLGLDARRLGEWVHPGEDPNRASDEVRDLLMRWVRLQYVTLLMGNGNDALGRFIGTFSLRYSELALVSQGKNVIAQALNNYFKGQHSENSEFTGLNLWFDLMVERRTDRGHLVSLGRVPSVSLSMGTSYATGRTHGKQLKGSRVFLQAGATESRASLELSAALFMALSRGRSLQTFERSNDDLDLAIRRFFLAAASRTPLEQAEVLRVLYVEDDEGAREIAWQMSSKLKLQDS